MGTRCLRFAAALSALGVLAGCSLLLDTSDASQAPAPAPVDGGVDSGSTQGTADAATDTSGSDDDAAGTADAGDDCADTLNDDFDTAPLGARWDALNAGDTMLTLDTSDSFSPPKSLLVTMPAGPEAQGSLSKNVPAAKAICCAMRVRVPQEHVRFLQIAGEQGNYLIYVATTSAKLSLVEIRSGTPAIDRTAGTWQTDGQWRRIRVEAQLPQGPGAGTLKMFVDGTQAVDAVLGDPSVDLKLDTIMLGAPYAQPESGSVIRFDDVRCSAK